MKSLLTRCPKCYNHFHGSTGHVQVCETCTTRFMLVMAALHERRINYEIGKLIDGVDFTFCLPQEGLLIHAYHSKCRHPPGWKVCPVGSSLLEMQSILSAMLDHDSPLPNLPVPNRQTGL
jgi:hypothetical protein